MKRVLSSLGALMLAVGAISAYGSEQPQYFQQFVHYTIKAKLNTEEHTLSGTETILYRNESPDTLSHLYLHLYPNAYKSKNTALSKSYRRQFNLTVLDIPGKYRASLDIENVSIDGNKIDPGIDDTIATLKLPSPMLPGDSITVEMTFSEKIRQHIGRAGRKGKHYDFAQWYPKVVVYDENGYHPDKFSIGEFYGEFGTFDVFMEIPEEYVVAATGIILNGDPGWNLNPGGKEDEKSDGQVSGLYKTVHFHADNVHDFAWSADPDFVVQDTTWNGVEIRSFYRKQHAKTWRDTTLAHGIRAIKWLSDRIGQYPYPQVSIVDALLGGGMEYPMLVMDGRANEGLVIHEVGHIYFYGIFGNDERAEAWLDEGFTTFQTIWYMNEKYGPWGKTDKRNFYERITPQYKILDRRRLPVFDLQRRKYGERIATRAEEFVHSYRINVYNKAALVFNALWYVVGDDKFDEILHEYFRRWKLRHVNESRFRKVCEDVSGLNLDWFFQEWLHSTKICDYKLDEMRITKSANSYDAGLTIKRLGEIIMPLKLEFVFEDGSKETFRIKGRLRTMTQVFKLDRKPVEARLNAENEILDINMSDNFLPRRHSLSFDWPGNNYFSTDGYSIKYRPSAWYNDLDGLKTGLHIKGSRAGWARKINLGVYYGFESKRLDFSAGASRNFRFFGGSGIMNLSGYKMEGRQDGRLTFSIKRRKRLLTPPDHDIFMEVQYHELADPRFITDPETYQRGSDLGFSFGYRIAPQLDIAATQANARIRFGREWFGGKYHYEKFRSSVVLKSRKSIIPISVRFRFFLGLAGGEIPYQQKFYLSGGGPLASETHFFLRSPGALPKDLNYHQSGGGNLRGYLAGNFGVNKMFAANFELDVPLPLIGRLTSPFLGKLHGVGFIDAGRVFDKTNPIETSSRTAYITDHGYLDKTLLDAGVGLRSARRFPFYNMQLRLDIPFFVNTPEINSETEKTDFRYVFSLGCTF